MGAILDKETGDPLVTQARQLLEERRYKEALEILKITISLDKNDPKKWFYQGQAHMFLGQYSMALSDFIRADILFKGEHADTKLHVSRVSACLGDYPNAIQYATECIELMDEFKFG